MITHCLKTLEYTIILEEKKKKRIIQLKFEYLNRSSQHELSLSSFNLLATVAAIFIYVAESGSTDDWDSSFVLIMFLVEVLKQTN